MPIKVSQLNDLATVDAGTLFSVVDTAGTLVSKKATALNVASYILTGNAASATKLVTPRTINGVSFDGSANITITTSLPTASTSVLGGVKVDGSTITINGSGVISGSQLYTLPAATSSTIGGIIKGNGLQVKNDGTLSTTTTPTFHGFVVNANGDLEYTKMTSGDLAVANGDATEQYVMWEIGTSDYSWKITADGLLQIEYTDSDI